MRWKERAEKVIAQGTCTYSKRWDQYVEGDLYPTHAYGLYADRLVDSKHEEYIDTVCALGANINGWRNACSLPLCNEVTLAEIIKNRVNCIDKLKFLKTGSCATQAAVRIARAWRQNSDLPHDKGLGCGYHGTHNWSIAAEEPGTGTVDEGYYKCGNFDQIIHQLERSIEQVAYVIIEPVELDYKVGHKLKKIRELCTEKNTVLIFDEIITGGRFLDFCVSNHFQIDPDIICLGKCIANGYPISVVGGKEKFMDTPNYFISSTFAGEERAILETIGHLNDFSNAKIYRLWEAGSTFQKSFNALSPQIQLRGYPARFVWEGDETYVAIFWQEMLKKGFLCGKAFFTNYEFIPLMDRFLAASDQVIKGIEKKNTQLEGLLPRPVFKR